MKGESIEELSRIHNAVMTAVNAHESIGKPINSHGMDLFNHLVVELLDSRTRMEWESSTSDLTEPPEHATLADFIAKRILTLNAAKPKTATKAYGDTSRTMKSLHAKPSYEHTKCALCQAKHSLMQCGDFKAKSASDRKSIVESHRLCYNCLGNHLVSKCQSVKTCLTCKAKHHIMLHDAYVSSNSNKVTALAAVRQPLDRKAVLLAIARVNISDRSGRVHKIRVLIDQGSEVSLVSESLVQRLRLPRSRSAVSIVGIGGTRSNSTRGKVMLNLSSSITGTKLSAVAFVLPRLSAYQGPTAVDSFSWAHIHSLELADPRYLEQDPVDVLLGAEVCSQIFIEGLRKGGHQDPIAQNTTLGWIQLGGANPAPVQKQRASFQCTIDTELDQLVHNFWNQEKEPSTSITLMPDDERCENFFSETHLRTASGRYVVRLSHLRLLHSTKLESVPNAS